MPTRLLVILIILVCSILTVTLPSKSHAESDSPWFSSLAPSIESEGITVPRLDYGNRECVNITSPTCEIRNSYGYFGSGLRMNASSYNYPVVSYFGDSRILPVPNSDTVVTYFSSPANGEYLFFTKDFYGSLQLKFHQGKLQYVSNKAPDGRLKDKSGRLLLSADFESITFSKNGRWMLAHAGGPGFLRVNMETFEILPFGPKYRFDPGANPYFQTAISNDGRYAMVASSKNGGLKVYDLHACADVPDIVIDPVVCKSRDLFSLFAPKVPGSIVGLTHIRFLDEDTAHLYVVHNTGTGNLISKYSLNAGGSGGMDYLALGDSYISGEGVFSYKNGTDISTNRCHLSNFSYPYLIGDLFQWSTYESVACSGSVVEDIIAPDEKAYNDSEKHGKGKSFGIYDSEIYSNFLPGYRPQINFVTKYRPDIITLSVGGNDIGFASILLRCLGKGTCYEFYEDRLELVRQVNSNFEAFEETYRALKDSTPTSAKIYVIGYPQIAKATGRCDNNVHLNKNELDFAEKLISYLNRVIKEAANYSGVFYVDTEKSLYSYRLCETDENNIAVHGLTAGNDTPSYFNGPFGKESYHPNGIGHNLLRNSLLHVTERFTKPMPSPDLSAKAPSENNLDILKATKSGRQTFTTYYGSDLTSDTQERGGLWHTFINGRKYSLKPSSSFKAVLSSEPIQLGTYLTNSSGDLDIQIQTPNDIPPGFHTLHLYGQNIEGTAIDIYKTIYVAASFDDLDGDGIQNSSEKCLVVEPVNKDFDNDGIDDACDGQITKPSSVTITEAVRFNTAGSNFIGAIPALFPSPVQTVAVNSVGTGAFLNNESVKSQTLGASVESENQKVPDSTRDFFSPEQYSPVVIGSLAVLAGGLVIWRFGRI